MLNKYYSKLSGFPDPFIRKVGYTIRNKWSNPIIKNRRKLCIFASWDPNSIVDPYVFYYLKELESLDFDIIFVTTSKNLAVNDLNKLKNICSLIIHRKNIGYDFYSWKTALLQVKKMELYEKLLITNDSVFGPLKTLQPIFSKMDAQPEIAWGMTDSQETGVHHLQSYFIYLDKKIFLSEAFKGFWKNFRVFSEKWQIITKGELGFSQALNESGITLQAYIPFADIAQKIEQTSRNFQYSKEMSQGKALNPTLFMWDIIIEEFGSPFLKTELLKANRIKSDKLTNWKHIIKNASNFQILNIIENYLNRLEVTWT